jgi:Flp pilus assembly protein TadD
MAASPLDGVTFATAAGVKASLLEAGKDRDCADALGNLLCSQDCAARAISEARTIETAAGASSRLGMLELLRSLPSLC